LRGDEGDAELREGSAELGGLALTSKFFFERPAGIAANKDAAAVAVEGRRDTAVAEQALQQAEIAFRGFRKEELRNEDFAGGIVLHAQRVRRGPRPSSQSCGLPSSCRSSPSRGERTRR